MKKSISDHTIPLKQDLITGCTNRREAIKAIASGVAAISAYNLLPVKWNKPVIEQIFLPAHAATSGSSLHDPCSVTLVSGHQSSNNVVVRVDGFITPPAANLSTMVVVTPVGAGSPVSVETTTSADGTFSVNMTIHDGPGISRVNAVTTVNGADGVASCGVDIVPLTFGILLKLVENVTVSQEEYFFVAENIETTARIVNVVLYDSSTGVTQLMDSNLVIPPGVSVILPTNTSIYDNGSTITVSLVEDSSLTDSITMTAQPW